jgi:hypothetical protein
LVLFRAGSVPAGGSGERIEIMLPNGRRLIVDVSVDMAVLTRLIQVVERA